MYKRLNIFVDLSYYHSLFLKNNKFKLDRAVNFYFDFINRLINNKEIDEEYSKNTIFIPIDPGVWPVAINSDIWDFRKNLNPISIIFRLVRINPAVLKKAFGNRSVIFVGSRGYFTIDFNKFELKNLSRVKTNLRKLMSEDEPIVDDFETDDLGEDAENASDPIEKSKPKDSSKAIAVKVIDQIEKDTSIKVDDISAIDSVQNKANDLSHLKINKDSISTSSEGDSIIIIIDPDGPNGYNDISKNISPGTKIDTYCILD